MVYQVASDITNYNNMPIKLFNEIKSTQEGYEERNSQIGSELIYSLQHKEPQNG
tara:strand:- start:82 stop:243 length:162 start_codon:yes stop_codon:yes gene_type:complete